MVDSVDIYKFFNINTATVMKIREMLKFAPDHLKTKQKKCGSMQLKNYLVY